MFSVKSTLPLSTACKPLPVPPTELESHSSWLFRAPMDQSESRSGLEGRGVSSSCEQNTNRTEESAPSSRPRSAACCSLGRMLRLCQEVLFGIL